MSLNFPNNPLDGDSFNGYIYNAAKGVWDSGGTYEIQVSLSDLFDVNIDEVVDGQALVYDSASNSWIPGEGGGGASFTISPTPPESPGVGDVWYSSLDGNSYIFYEDEDSSQWVEMSNPAIGPVGAQGVQGIQGETGLTGLTGAGVAEGGDEGQVLAKQSSDDFDTAWIYPVTSLEGLSDTNINEPLDREVLVYDSASGNWINETIEIPELDDLPDVNVSTASSEDVLVFDGTNWIPGQRATTGKAIAMAIVFG
jgi:hypothetical protein